MAKIKGAQRFPKNPQIIEALQEAIHKYSVEEVAIRLEKNPQHFYIEINPYAEQRKAKIGLDDAIEATRIIGCKVWLEMLAAEFGYHLIPIATQPDKGTVAEELTDDLEHLGEFSRTCKDSGSTEKQIRAASQALRQDVRQTEELAVKILREKRDRPVSNRVAAQPKK